MNHKKLVKKAIRLVIESNANPVTIVISLSKKQLFKILDSAIPDEPDEEK